MYLLLELLKASLWRTPPRTQPFVDRPDWDAIARMAMEQTVGPLVMDGAMRLPADLRPPKDWAMKGCAMVERNRRTHRLMDSCVAETFATLREAGLSPVLLKGQAYARFYPDPTLRQCGDIDIYVGSQDYRRAYEVAGSNGWECDNRFDPDAKHYVCSLRGVKIELHHTAAQLVSQAADRRFRQWSLGHLDGTRGTVTIGGEAVAVPSPMFDIVFVFTHLLHHYLIGGVGLRQVCDWVMLLHAHAAVIDCDELRARLTEFGMLRAWRIFTPLAVDILGLPAEECPLYTPRYLRKARTILSHILSEGNFGRCLPKDSRRPKGYLSGKVYSYVRYTRRLYSKLHADPVLIIRHHISFTVSGIRRIFRDQKAKFTNR